MPKKKNNTDNYLNTNMVTNGILLLSFAITVLSQPNMTQSQKYIAYFALFTSIVFAVCSLLHRNVHFLSKRLVNIVVSMFVYLAWIFTFAMKWLDGIKNTKDVEQLIISILGMIWLFSILMILTRLLTIVTENLNRPFKWFSFIIPLAIICENIIIFYQGNVLTGFLMLVFVIGSMLISLKIWKPVGAIPILGYNISPA